MDTLHKSLLKKKKERESINNNTTTNTLRYIKKSDINDNEYKKKLQYIKNNSNTTVSKKNDNTVENDDTIKNETINNIENNKKNITSSNTTTPPPPPTLENISLHRIKYRLRQLEQPITLFGETISERIERLKEAQIHFAELQENPNGQKNILKQLINEKYIEEQEKLATNIKLQNTNLSTQSSNSVNNSNTKNNDKYQNNRKRDEFNTLQQYIRYCFKHWLYLWEKQVEQESTNRLLKQQRTSFTPIGKQDSVVIFKDTKTKLQPFFLRLRNNSIEQDILQKLENICKFCQDGNYVAANEEYLKVSIGNAAWPMGATMVGIHERAGREKISSDKVAHIMNDETTRSYLHAIKRLITFSQSIYPVVPSRMCPQ